MPLWRPEGFADDSWIAVPDDAAAPRGRQIVVSLKRWLAESEALSARASAVGVVVEAGTEAQAHLHGLATRPLVALGFAKFADGRCFSYARLLRDRYGFRGELRATGEVLLDEIPLMLRCGFDSFEVTNEPTLRALKGGRIVAPALYYQPGAGERPAGDGARHWFKADGGDGAAPGTIKPTSPNR